MYAYSEYFLHFLYMAALIPNKLSLPISYATTNEIMEWSATLHCTHMSPHTLTPMTDRTAITTKIDSTQARDDSMVQVAAALVSMASNLARNTDRLMEARSSNNPSSSRSWEKEPKFLQDQILSCLMATHDDDIVNDPISPNNNAKLHSAIQ